MSLFSWMKKPASGSVVLQNGIIRAVIDPLGACVKELYFSNVLVGRDGITVGRYANRIKGGKLAIGEKEYRLEGNENGHCLHGGPEGFDKRLWKLEERTESSARLTLLSPDGDQGFPGDLSVSVLYELGEEGSLSISYSARSSQDTAINLTNHTYFNLNGGGSAKAHSLQIDAQQYTEVDSELIPTGRLLPVDGTRFDFRVMRQFDPGHDENYVLQGSGMRSAACLMGDESCICMDVSTDQPGLQLYNTDTHICLETQHFPDSPNNPDFPTTLLKAGEEFRSRTIYSFMVMRTI